MYPIMGAKYTPSSYTRMESSIISTPCSLSLFSITMATVSSLTLVAMVAGTYFLKLLADSA